MKGLLKRKTVYSAIAGLLTTAIVVTSIHFSQTQAAAKETFSGILDLVDENSQDNPFVIYEIVPDTVSYNLVVEGQDPVKLDMAMGELGYYIDGAEPIGISANLAKLSTPEQRRAYMNMVLHEDGGMLTGPLSAIASDQKNGAPLFYAPYEEAYSLSEDAIKKGEEEGNPWILLQVSEDHEELLTGIEMKKALNGNYLKTFSPSENAIAGISKSFLKFVAGSEVTALDGIEVTPLDGIMEKTTSGEFDPAFTVSAKGDFAARFKVNTAHRGYRVKADSATEVNKTSVVKPNTAVYELYTNSEGKNYYVYVGKFAEVKSTLPSPESDAPTGSTKENKKNHEDVDDDAEDTEEEEEESNGSEGDDSVEPVEEAGDDSDEEESEEESSGDREDSDDEESASAAIKNRAVAARPAAVFIDRIAEADVDDAKKNDASEDNSSDDEEVQTEDDDEIIIEEGNGNEEEVTEEVVGVEYDDPEEEFFEDETLEEVYGAEEILGEEDVVDITETGAGSGLYYTVSFEYSSGYTDEPCYSVDDWDVIAIGTSDNAYLLDGASLPDDQAKKYLAPNYAHTGSIAGTSLEQYVFTYKEPEDEKACGNYVLEAAEGNTEVYRVIGIKTYYRGGLLNNNWFTKYVFDRVEDDDVTMSQYLFYDYQCYTPRMFSAAVEPGAAGLIYLSNPTGRFIPDGAVYGEGGVAPVAYSKDNDITASTFRKILNAVINDNLPVIVDYTIAKDSSLDGTYIQKLAKILALEDPSLVNNYINNESVSDENLLKIDLGDYEKYDPVHHVHDSIYIYDYSGYETSFANTAFKTNFSNAGFEEIINLIDDENQYRRSEGSDSFIPDDINQAVAIKYILCYKARRGIDTKSEIKVLELQPGPSVPEELSEMTEGNLYIDPDDEFTLYRVKNKAGDIEPLIEDAPYPIVLDSMSTREFVGREEDLNSEYDLVYIGLSTYHMNTKTISGNDRVVYNDKDMEGLVYANVGDYVREMNYVNGWLDRDYDGGSLKPIGWHTIDDERGLHRYSGNDITERKKDALIDYAKAAYPVLLDYHCIEGNITSTQIDDSYIDNQSYLYEFIDWAVDEYGVNNNKNIFRINADGNLSGNEKMFSWYLNLAKPEIEIEAGIPHLDYAEYVVQDGESYYMDYQFEILDKRTSDPDNRYTVKLYIDDNADGKYPESELSTEVMSRKPEITDGNGNKVDSNKLKAGKTYRLRQYVAEKFSIGPLPWKLEISLNKQKERRDSVIGCYKIHRAGAKDISVNCIQIVPNGYYKGWNLEDAMNGKGTNNNGVTSLKNLVANLPDYNIRIKTMTSNEFVWNLKQAAESTPSYDYLNKNEINLIVLGFGFHYEIFDDDLDSLSANLAKSDVDRAVNRIKTYIASGHSTVIGADVVSRTGYAPGVTVNASGRGNRVESWGYNTLQWLRPMAGMDRYNITGKSRMQGHDEAKAPNDGDEVEEIQGYGNTILNQDAAGNDTTDKKEYNKYYSYSGDAGKFTANDSTGYGKVSKINDGQLTLFPYALDEIYSTNDNDWPYYSLDLQGDEDGDGESDVTVWYAFHKMGNSDYVKLNKKDARDLYYLYTKGNITYVGTCLDAGGDTTEYELIVNVLIAAYEGGVQDPVVTIIDNENIDSTAIDTIYLPYYNDVDTGVQLIKGDDQNIYYYASNISTKAESVATYYYVPNDGSGDTQLQLNTGEVVNVKRLPITSVQKVGEDGEREAVERITVHATDADGHDYTIEGYEQLGNIVYDIQVPLSSIMGADDQSVDVYVHVDSVKQSNYEGADSDVTYGNDKVTLMKSELFNLD